MRIPIVNEQDEILYYKESSQRDIKKEIVRIAGLWVTNEKGQWLLAKRSKNKKTHPNLWGPSVAGSVEEGETYESNILKEAKEEIGVDVSQTLSVGPKLRVSSSHEYFGQYFFATINSDATFQLQELEVDEVKWITIPDLKAWYFNSPEEFTNSFGRSIEVIEKYENKS